MEHGTPMPGWSPFVQPIFYPQGGNGLNFEDHRAPSRVRIALEFLGNLMIKKMTRAAISDVSIELIPGQGLTPTEEDAENAAHDLLRDYFMGRLKTNKWEERALKERNNAIPTDVPGSLIMCPPCQNIGVPKKGCPLCHDSGQLLVFPHFDVKKDQ